MPNRREGRTDRKWQFICFHILSLTISVGSSLLLTYFFIIPHGDLKRQMETTMELSAKILQIQISLSSHATDMGPHGILSLQKRILDLASELEILKLNSIDQQKRIEECQARHLVSENNITDHESRVYKLESTAVTGIRLTGIQSTAVYRGYGYGDELGWLITGVTNFNQDQYVDNLHRRKLEKCVNGKWSPTVS